MSFPIPSTWHSRPSPNHGARPANTKISGIVLHADAASTIASSMDWCRRRESGVSYHIMIGRNGSIYWLVPPERRAWHAGPSSWDGVRDCNNYTIGVCLSNRNDGVEPYSLLQRMAAVEVCALLCKHFDIPTARITTHALVATPKGRKTDPRGLDLSAFLTTVEGRMATLK